jgi:hypothetical protein
MQDDQIKKLIKLCGVFTEKVRETALELLTSGEENDVERAQYYLQGALNVRVENGDIPFEEAEQYYKDIGLSKEEITQARRAN